jgi:hypothetical protein
MVIITRGSDIAARAVLLTEIPRVIIGDRVQALNRDDVLKIKVNHGLDTVEVLLVICVCDHGLIIALGSDIVKS